jgi:hypothetical protein
LPERVDDEAPKKKKKRKRPADEPAESDGGIAAETSASGAPIEVLERPEEEDAPPPKISKKAPLSVEPPRFLASFPNDAALSEIVAAFERGDYAFVRTAAPALARSTKSDEVRRAALELRRRIDPDRLSLLLIAFAFALLVVLSLFYWTHKHP